MSWSRRGLLININVNAIDARREEDTGPSQLTHFLRILPSPEHTELKADMRKSCVLFNVFPSDGYTFLCVGVCVCVGGSGKFDGHEIEFPSRLRHSRARRMKIVCFYASIARWARNELVKGVGWCIRMSVICFMSCASDDSETKWRSRLRKAKMIIFFVRCEIK